MAEYAGTEIPKRVDPIQNLETNWIDAGFLRYHSVSDFGSSSEILSQTINEKRAGAITSKDTNLQDYSSTEKSNRPSTLSSLVVSLFNMRLDVAFEDGVESVFSRALLRTIDYYGVEALVEMFRLILTETVNEEIWAEAERWLGQIKSPNTHRFRLSILIHSLSHKSPRIRDGAILGLSFMNDKDALSEVERAYNSEKIPELKEDILKVLKQLKG